MKVFIFYPKFANSLWCIFAASLYASWASSGFPKMPRYIFIPFTLIWAIHASSLRLYTPLKPDLFFLVIRRFAFCSDRVAHRQLLLSYPFLLSRRSREV